MKSGHMGRSCDQKLEDLNEKWSHEAFMLPKFRRENIYIGA
jgi:hypothetical protein